MEGKESFWSGVKGKDTQRGERGKERRGGGHMVIRRKTNGGRRAESGEKIGKHESEEEEEGEAMEKEALKHGRAGDAGCVGL